MTTIMNNNVSVSDFNTNTNNHPANTLNGIENGVCTIKCTSSTSSIDASGDYRITRRLECLWTNQGLNQGDKILDLEIAGSKGTTPVVTVNGQVIPVGALAFDAAGNLEVRSSTGMLLDIITLPDECSMSATGFGISYAKDGADPKYGPGIYVAKAFLGIAVRPVSADLAHNLVIDPSKVCVINEVLPGSPAFVSGLEPNDVLLGINGKQANLANLRHELETAKTGDSVTLIFLCKGVKREASVELGTCGWTTPPTQIKAGFKYPLNPVVGTPFQEKNEGDIQNPCTSSGGYSLDVNSPANVETTWISAGSLI
jgi:hypothetical protein